MKQDRVWTSKGRRCGKPCVRGTRIDVMLVVHCLEDWSLKEIRRQFPGLTREGCWTALAYYARNKKRLRPDGSLRNENRT